MDQASAAPRRALLRMITLGGAVTAAGAFATACGRSGSKASASASGTPGAEAAPGADTIMIIRHGEKPDENGKKAPFGVTEEGEQNVHALLVRGWQRAGALVGLFAPDGGTPLRKGLQRPDAVYAAGPHPGEKGLRPSETVAPVAAKLKVRANLKYLTGDEAALAKELRGRRGRTLVSWEHHAIHTIVKGLGTVRPAPPHAWPDDRFDLVWVFVRTGDGWAFSQVPQLLLDGDSANPA
ncbi:hypothetical protein CTZ27_02510 [Streptomyces griseocarneus]|nr:hypothetical protein CTZ27_02510 [Streptomyces griseocarneus]